MLFSKVYIVTTILEYFDHLYILVIGCAVIRISMCILLRECIQRGAVVASTSSGTGTGTEHGILVVFLSLLNLYNSLL